jgi:hypothetical protein
MMTVRRAPQEVVVFGPVRLGGDAKHTDARGNLGAAEVVRKKAATTLRTAEPLIEPTLRYPAIRGW